MDITWVTAIIPIYFPVLTRGCTIQIKSVFLNTFSSQVGMKKSKLVEQILQQFGVGILPMPTENISTQFNELRNDILFLLELKIAQETLQFDMQSLKHRVR